MRAIIIGLCLGLMLLFPQAAADSAGHELPPIDLHDVPCMDIDGHGGPNDWLSRPPIPGINGASVTVPVPSSTNSVYTVTITFTCLGFTLTITVRVDGNAFVVCYNAFGPDSQNDTMNLALCLQGAALEVVQVELQSSCNPADVNCLTRPFMIAPPK